MRRRTTLVPAVALLATSLAASAVAPVAAQSGAPPTAPTATTAAPSPRSAAGRATPEVAVAVATPVGVATRWGTLETPGAVAVSLMIRNDGPPDRLVAASSTAALRVDLHRTVGRGRDRAMVSHADGIPVPSGLVVLDAANDHPMLVGLSRDLVQGEEVPLRLAFAGAGEAVVAVRVRRRLDAAGLEPIPPVRVGSLEISLASAPPAPADGRGGSSPSPGPAPTAGPCLYPHPPSRRNRASSPATPDRPAGRCGHGHPQSRRNPGQRSAIDTVCTRRGQGRMLRPRGASIEIRLPPRREPAAGY